MAGGKRFWSLLCAALMLLLLAMPALAADPQVTKDDLKGISPKRHRYIFSTVGGALVGMGIGELLGGGNDVVKGLMVGAGGGSAFYLHTHPRENLAGWRNWVFMGSYTSLGGGLGWTACGCNTGLVSGALIGGGASAWYAAAHGTRTNTTATTTNP